MPLPDKEFKKQFKKEVSKDPHKYFATKTLKKEGFRRGECSNCGTFFWSTTNRTTCDDASCSGGFRFFKNNPAKEALDYIEVWRRFSDLFTSLGYTPIDRYPVIARWRDDTEFVQASIYDFQPYVVNGEVDPPANPLVVPQFSLRFNDIDNVGITMSHMTGFVMIGQHAFLPKEEWDQEKLFHDIYTWLRQGLGLAKEEITFHEDAWAGGGNFGPCMEFFSRGCELGNQVYMLYEQTETGRKELRLKVLDMGMGHERVAWFTQGKGTIYDAAFPTVMQGLYERTGISLDQDLIEKYLPHAAYLNVDESDDIGSEWEKVAKKMGLPALELRTKIMPLAALFSVAEHSRSLLLALSDGGLPSNVGGGYNLRVILRRALGFIDEYEWDISLFELCQWHAEYLVPLFPELSENLDDVEKILQSEIKKYDESQKRCAALVEKIIAKGEQLSVEKLIELYDSHGVSPEDLARSAKAQGTTVQVPDNFYSLVAQRHDLKKNATATKKEIQYDLTGIAATQALYFDHYDYVNFDAVVEKIIEGNKVILSRTAFYPTSGGQIHDLGTLNDCEVLEVSKQANEFGVVIIHHMKESVSWKIGERVFGKVDSDRRLQLAQHHSATHLLTGSSRQVLGNHVWQAGASKTVDKSRLDITHYEQLSSDEIARIEAVANKLVDENRPIIKSFMDRAIAESKYGFRLYQGGAVPGKRLRIVNIEDFDVEACGGTHLNLTGEIGHIKILKTSKIQDGVVRLEFVAGRAAEKALHAEKTILKEAMEIVGGTASTLPARAQELFEKWKQSKKGALTSFDLVSQEQYEGDVIAHTATILKTQPEHIVKTLKRFSDDIEKKQKKE